MLKIVYKILTVIICSFWIFAFLFFVSGTFQRTFVYPEKYSGYVEEYSEVYGVERSLVYAVMKAESKFNPKAKSKKGAKGLMQITNSTADFIAERLKIGNYDIYDVDTNIRFGCWYLSYLSLKFEDITAAIAAYNAGEGRVAEWLSDKKYSIDGITLDNIPFKETETYVKKVIKNKNHYEKLYSIK